MLHHTCLALGLSIMYDLGLWNPDRAGSSSSSSSNSMYSALALMNDRYDSWVTRQYSSCLVNHHRPLDSVPGRLLAWERGENLLLHGSARIVACTCTRARACSHYCIPYLPHGNAGQNSIREALNRPAVRRSRWSEAERRGNRRIVE